MTSPLDDLLARLPRPQPRTAKILAGLGLAVSLAALTVFIGIPRLLDGTRQGQAVANEIAQATGLRVKIAGGVQVSLWPQPHIAISEFSLVSLDGRNTYLSVPRLDLNVTLSSLLGGNYVVTDLTLNQPQMQVVRAADGSYQGLPMPRQLQQLALREIKINNGQVILQNGNVTETFAALSGKVGLPDNTSLLQVGLDGQWRGAPMALMIDAAAPLGNDPSLVRVNLDLGAAESALRFSGMIDFAKADWPGQGQLDVNAAQGAALWALASSIGAAPAEPGDAALRAPFTFGAVINGNRDHLDFEGVRLALGSFKAEGLARYVAGRDGGLSVAFKTSALDLADWPTLIGWGRSGQVEIPPQWLGAFDLNLAGANFGVYSASTIRLKGDIKNGQISLSDASAVLPGNTRVSYVGDLMTKAQTPLTLAGKIALETVQLRDLLKAYGVNVPDTLDAASLQQFKLGADVRGPVGTLGISGLDMALDGTRMSGQISPRGTDGRYTASLNIEEVNLDHYVSTAGLPDWIWSLPATNYNLRVNRVQAGDKSAENVSLQASVADDLLTVKSLEAADFGGTRLRLSGTVSADEAKDSDLALRLTAPDFAMLRQSFPPVMRLVPDQLAQLVSGNTDLSVRWRRAAGETQQLISATYGDGRFDVVQTMRPQAPTTWKARVQNRETANWLRVYVPAALSRPDAVLGLMDLYAEGVALDDTRWQIRAIQGQLAGLSFKGGDITFTPGTAAGATAGTPWQAEGQLSLGQGSFDLWAQTINPLALLGKGTLGLTVTAEKLMFAGAPLEDVNASVQLTAGGQLSLTQATARWHDGTATVNGQLSLLPTLSLKGQLDLRETNMAWMGGDRFGLDGVMDFSLRADGQGRDWADLIHNLAGDGEVTIDSGTLKGLDLAALTEALLDKRSNADLNTLLARGGNSALSSFGGDFNIEEGVVRAPQLRLRTPAASADVSADLDLSGPRLDASAKISLRELNGAPPLGLHLSGPLDRLTPSFDSAALTAQLNPPPEAAKSEGQNGKPPPAADAAEGAKVQALGNAASDKPESATDNSATDTGELKPPELPSPPALDEPAAEPIAGPDGAPLASPDDLAAAPQNVRTRTNSASAPAATSTPRRPNRAATATNRNATTGSAAASSGAPARVATGSSSATGGLAAPPSIQELLDAMPALQGAASAAVNGGAVAGTPRSGNSAVPTPVDDALPGLQVQTPGSPPPAAVAAPAASPARRSAAAKPDAAKPAAATPALPDINFTPVETISTPKLTAAPAAPSGLAPEFEGEKPRATSDSADPAPGVDVVVPGDDGQPAASVDDLMNRVQ